MKRQDEIQSYKQTRKRGQKLIESHFERSKAFLERLEGAMLRAEINREFAKMRFVSFKLYEQVKSLYQEHDIYTVKLLIAYLISYIEEFLDACEKTRDEPRRFYVLVQDVRFKTKIQPYKQLI